MRSWLVVLAAACLLATAVVAEAPATLVDRQLDMLTHGRLRVADASGTIWNGSGTLIVLPYGTRVPLLWHIEALPLLRSRLVGTLGRDASESQPAAFDVGGDDFTMHHFAIALPAEALLRAADAPALIVAAGGTVDVRIDDFALHHGSFDGGFVARWQGASLPGPRPDTRVALGDVRFDGATNRGEVQGALTNEGGDIEIRGNAVIAATGSVRAEALMKPRAGVDPERSKAISAALAMIGTADGSGGFRVAWQAPGR